MKGEIMKDEIFNKIMILEQELETYKKSYESMKANNQQLKLHLQIYKTDLDNLQDRIDEAVEYINKSEYATIESYKHIHADNEGKVYNLDVLLKILKGE